MSRTTLESPVQTQAPVGVLKSHPSFSGPTGRRRVFVQTETGCVLGMDLDRTDNVHTVKRRLQIALHVPTDETSLTYGDMVLKNDLDAIRPDSPLLLTRGHMHRSSSTPCLSPRGGELQDRSNHGGPIEVLGKSDRFRSTRQRVKEIVKAIKNGVEPLPVHSGLGGAYYFRNVRGESVAIVKPTDEEPFAPNNPKGFVGRTLGQPGLKPSVRVGETGIREVAAYLLDHDHFANVPATALVKVTHSIFNINDGVNGNKLQNTGMISKLASFQQFIPHDFDASDHGTSSYPVSAVHRIGILDIRIFNTDRHAGNLLVKKLDGTSGRFGEVELIPIDHGLCLPESLEDPYFEWIHWPQASIPFSEDELEYIRNLDPIKDCEMLRLELPMIREACLRVLVLCTIFVKEAAASGLCLAEIGEMMTREFRSGEEEPSELELVCIEARRLVGEREVLTPKSDRSHEDDQFQFHIDCDDLEWDFSPKMTPMDDFFTRSPPFGMNPRSPLSKLEESLDEGEDSDDSSEENRECLPVHPIPEKFPPVVPKLSKSLRTTSLGENNNNLKFSWGSKPTENGYSSSSSGHRSANEQLPVSASFVKVADMSDDEWGVFLEKVVELLPAAFEKRKAVTMGNKQRQRLGTSCQF